MKSLSKREQRIKAGKKIIEQLQDEGISQTSRLALIQMLVPVGLLMAQEEMNREVGHLAGKRYQRGQDNRRWGWNPGSIYLGDQKVGVPVPRVRNRKTNQEVVLNSYQGLQNARMIDEMTFKRVLKGISQRSYEEAIIQVPQTFGIRRSTVSRRYIRSTGSKLRAFLERDLSVYDIVAIVLDGKTYVDNQIVVALGVTMEGDKILLGFTEAHTENYQICKEFLKRLLNRGLRTDREILFVVDGAKGLRKGILETFGDKAWIQRCQWHKRENVLRYLNREHQDYFRRKLQAAYEQPSYEMAKKRLEVVRRELRPLNESAVSSLEEGLEETLTLHRLGMFKKVGVSFKTTNCLENVNGHLARYTRRVSRWYSSDHKWRWIGSVLMDVEGRLRRVKGREFLPVLRESMRRTRIKTDIQRLIRAA